MERRGLGRDGLAATATMAVVWLVYGTPVLLGLVGSFNRGDALDGGSIRAPAPEREVVWWMPPEPPEAEVVADAEPVSDPSPAATDVDAPDEPQEANEVDASEELAVAGGPTRIKRRARRAPRERTPRIAAAPEPPVPLTPKEERELERKERKKERRAERKQCAELVDQIVQIDEDEWWFGRELVNCYRTHLEQFDMIGGVAWHDDEKGKNFGIRVYVSRSRRGEPGRLAGFQSGDVIRSVNGVRVGGWGGVAVASTQLLRSHVKVKRFRDGEEQIVHLRVKDPEEIEQVRLEQQAVVESAPASSDGSGG